MGNIEENCIASWKSYLPDYDIKQWSESSLDLSQYPFAWQALQVGKYAFVSDVVRLYALYVEGGIYLDTDMLLLRSFNPLLDQDFFTGEYRQGGLAAAVIGSKAEHHLLCKLIEEYQNLDFDFLNPKTIPDVFDEVIWNLVDKTVKIYSPEFFYPLPFEAKGEDFLPLLTENSYAVHLWNYSWKDEFASLREDRFLYSIYLAFKHYCNYSKIYRNKAYLSRYSSQFKKHLRRYLRKKWDAKLL